MRPEEVAALAAIRDGYATAVSYTGAGLSGDLVQAIKSDVPADGFQGPGNTLRRISYEIAYSELPSKPSKTDIIVDGDEHWRVNDVTRRRDVEAWELIVEEAYSK